MKDKISIIVPIYNVEKYICKCIESILCQTYKNIEIVLVDDGSPDKCGKICDEYQKKDNRIKVIHQKNGGLSAARNTGIKNSTGKFLMFVDSDDYIKNDMAEYLYNLLTKHQCDISICNYTYIFENKNQKDYIANKETYEDIYTKKDALEELLRNNKIQNFTWNKLYKKELFKSIKFPEGRLMEDVGTTYKLFMKSKKIICGSESKYFYIQRNGSILHNKKSKFYIDYYELANKRFNDIKNKYSTMETNYISILNISFSLISVQNKNVQEYVKNNNIISNTNKIIAEIKKIGIQLDLKDKIKILLYKTNLNIFKFVLRGWMIWILKNGDVM